MSIYILIIYKGRQLFEKDRSLADSDANLMGKGDEAVDYRKFEKNKDEQKDEQDENLVQFSDQDD